MIVKIKTDVRAMKAKDLKPGDVFRFVPTKPEWATYIYVRTNDPIGKDGNREVVLINKIIEDTP